MRILMFGRGTIAAIYGQVFRAAGHEVSFFVRPGRAAEYGDTVEFDVLDGRRGPKGRLRGTFPIRYVEELDPADGFDLVVLSVGHHRLAAAAEFLAPRIGNATVLVFGNVWDEPSTAVAPLPIDQVVFGFPQAGGGFDADGVLHGALFRSVFLEARPASDPRATAVRRAFADTGLRVREQSDMRGWLFVHFVSDAGMYAQAERSGSMAAMIGDGRAFRAAFSTTRDLLPLLEARGVDLRGHRSTTLPFRLAGLIGPAAAWATTRFPMARASLAAHTDPAAPEAVAVLDDTRRSAREHGIAVPGLGAR